jgi:glycosyltransferase involved in cell wall biosynthesis
MRVLFLADGDLLEPSARFRAHQFVPGLAALGVEALVLSAKDRGGPSGKRRVVQAARRADVVVLQRILPPPVVLNLLARVNPALVFDIDDALYALPSRRKRLGAVLCSALEVVAGSEEIARNVRMLSRSVTVIPTVVDPASYTPATPSVEGRAPRLGWIGTAGNLPFLELVRPALCELAARGLAFDIRVISSWSPDWPELPVTPVQWRLDGAAAALAELDVGLAPLPDTTWTRGKFPVKAIEYMATGVPVVASPVGALARIVVHGETGFLAASERDWVEHLDRLGRDMELRRRLGATGRRRVEEHYSVAAALPALIGVLERAVASVRKSAA